MKRLTNDELAFVKAFNVKPDDWQDLQYKPSRKWDYAEIATWCMHNGIAPYVHDKISAADFLKGIEDKFWDDEGFDALSLEDVAIWVLTTYYTYDQIHDMTLVQVIQALQDWKYFCGFRKIADFDAIQALSCALGVFDGYLVQDPDSDDVFYIEKEKANE